MKISAPSSDLLRLSATEMACQLRERTIRSVDLVEAHIARIEATHDDLNAVVVPMFDQARQAAEQADRLLQETGVEQGALLGVPVTIKEFFDVAGTPTTGGIQASVIPKAKSDAVAVAKLRAAGAIILGKTNVPQMGIAIESDNPVYGRTSNPWDLDRSSGGSSGGEAAIVSAYGSPLGLGSDGGGSIRIPSHFTGICGLKPTAGRLSMRGHWLLPCFPPGWATPGPMARSVEDLELAMRCFLTPHAADDPWTAPTSLASSQGVDLANLRIGYFDDDLFTSPSPAIRRGVELAKQQLASSGATFVPFEPPPILDAWKIELGLLYADGGRWMKQLLQRSPVTVHLKKTLLSASLPTIVRRFIPIILEQLGQKTVAKLLRLSVRRELTAYRYQEVLVEQEKFKRQFVQRWDDQQLDALICPPFPTVAMKHDSPDILMGIGYTFIFNLLGNPAGVVPITTVQVGEETERQSSADDFTKNLCRAESGSQGLPVGIQVVGRHWREDTVLAIMQRLQAASGTG